MLRTHAVGASGGAGPCDGGGEGVSAVCGNTALVGTVVRAGGCRRCVCGTRDGVVRCSAPCGSGGLSAPFAQGHGGDAVGGGRCSIGASGGRGRRGGGVVMVLVAPHSLTLRESRPLSGVDLCGLWSLAGLPG